MIDRANQRTGGGCLLILLMATIGCHGQAGEGARVSGFVTAAGQPLSGAVITLEPLAGTTGPNASAPVLAGRFEITPAAGLHGGQYRVRFSMIPASLIPASLRANISTQAGLETSATEQMIDPAFDAQSTLQCQLNRGDPNELNFEVKFLK
jgi:hypothetical protein